MEMLVNDAPAIGSDNNTFQNKVNKNEHNLLSVSQYFIMLFPMWYPCEIVGEGGKYDVRYTSGYLFSSSFFVAQGIQRLRWSDEKDM